MSELDDIYNASKVEVRTKLDSVLDEVNEKLTVDQKVSKVLDKVDKQRVKAKIKEDLTFGPSQEELNIMVDKAIIKDNERVKAERDSYLADVVNNEEINNNILEHCSSDDMAYTIEFHKRQKQICLKVTAKIQGYVKENKIISYLGLWNIMNELKLGFIEWNH